MKRKIGIVLVLCTVLSLFSSCAKKVENNASIYYLSPAEDEVLEKRDVYIAPGEKLKMLRSLAERMVQPTNDDAIVSPFPEDTEIVYLELEDDIAKVVLSREYQLLSGYARTLAASCICNTLTSLDFVDCVAISIENDPTTQSVNEIYRRSSFSNDAIRAARIQMNLNLYFCDEQTGFLSIEPRSIVVSNSTSVPYYIITELLNGPAIDGHISAIPEGVRLINILVENGHCTLNLSSEFLTLLPQDENAQRKAVESIVYSLTNSDEVFNVLITIEGKSGNLLEFVDLSSPLSAADFE